VKQEQQEKVRNEYYEKQGNAEVYDSEMLVEFMKLPKK